MSNQQQTSKNRPYLENTIDDRLQSYIDELSNDTTLTEMNIKEKSLNRAYIGAKWCTYSYQEENYLKRLKKQLEDYKTINIHIIQNSQPEDYLLNISFITKEHGLSFPSSQKCY